MKLILVLRTSGFFFVPLCLLFGAFQGSFVLIFPGFLLLGSPASGTRFVWIPMLMISEVEAGVSKKTPMKVRNVGVSFFFFFFWGGGWFVGWLVLGLFFPVLPTKNSQLWEVLLLLGVLSCGLCPSLL